MPARPACLDRPAVRSMVIACCVFAAFLPSNAGGPRYVAGASYFDRAVKGIPLTWPSGQISYYTDQGNLSGLMNTAAADALVADAFSRWTAIPTAAISATRAGQLDEDVNGASLSSGTTGGISLPNDLLPNATDKPLAIVYDSGGEVTNALLGQGAGDSSACFSNAVFGGPDNFSTDAHILHAVIVLNGNCVQTAAQKPDMEYRLVRMLGRVLGLDWSQANLNPATADYNGFTVMHAVDSAFCVPISSCYPAADQPKMDDRAALSRLYPVTTENQAAFAGKQLFYENTIRVHGSVRFTDENGFPAQPMEGVNVVARWIDPSTGQASRTYVASSVSGFLFRGNAGNAATGFNDSAGQRLDRFGSDDPALEGFFDLAGLEIPDGSDSAQYQIIVEPLDPNLSQTVGPYAPWQVQPSGAPHPITINVNRGEDLEQGILMLSSAAEKPDWFGSNDPLKPAAVPGGGDWTGSLSGYGNADYFRFAGKANRTLSIEVTAIDQAGAPAQNKARPVIGIWQLADSPATPAPGATASAFNTASTGMTRLDVGLGATTDYRVVFADQRGDGRPDYRYHARVFYGDRVIPDRAGVGGGTPITIAGLGLRANTSVSIAGLNTSLLATSSNQILTSAPPAGDGVKDIALADPATGAASGLFAAITYGAGPSDTIKLLAGTNPNTPVGADAPNPVRVQVVGPDGVSPVPGASVVWTSAQRPAFRRAAALPAAPC